jgi:hypothetical protein
MVKACVGYGLGYNMHARGCDKEVEMRYVPGRQCWKACVICTLNLHVGDLLPIELSLAAVVATLPVP